VDAEGGGDFAKALPITPDMTEMDIIEHKRDIRNQIASVFQIPPSMMNDLSTSGGLNSENMQLSMELMLVAERAHQYYHNNIFPAICDALEITDWDLKFPRSIEADKNMEAGRRGINLDNMRKVLEMGMEIKMKSVIDGEFEIHGTPQQPTNPMSAGPAFGNDPQQGMIEQSPGNKGPPGGPTTGQDRSAKNTMPKNNLEKAAEDVLCKGGMGTGPLLAPEARAALGTFNIVFSQYEGLTEEVSDKINTVLFEFVARPGMISLVGLTDAIRGVAPNMSRDQAETIAITELGRLVNKGREIMWSTDDPTGAQYRYYMQGPEDWEDMVPNGRSCRAHHELSDVQGHGLPLPALKALIASIRSKHFPGGKWVDDYTMHPRERRVLIRGGLA